MKKAIIGCYNDDGTFEDDKIVFIFRNGSEISGKIQTTKKKNIIDKYEEFEKNMSKLHQQHKQFMSNYQKQRMWRVWFYYKGKLVNPPLIFKYL